VLNLKKNAIIPASPDSVFDVIFDTTNMPQVWPNVSNIRNLQSLPNGGHSFQFDYTMAGLRLNGSGTDLLVLRPSRLVTRTTGGVTSTLSWTFKPILGNTQTELTLDANYEVPIPLVGRLAEYLVARINETDIAHMLSYLQRKFSSG
jgi:ribosome-associated toxin RatA of RatAB toxin-antitoxin module